MTLDRHRNPLRRKRLLMPSRGAGERGKLPTTQPQIFFDTSLAD